MIQLTGDPAVVKKVLESLGNDNILRNHGTLVNSSAE